MQAYADDFRFSAPYHSKPSIWRAPTWSWLSSNDSVWCGPVSEHHWSCPQKDVCAELDHIDVETKPSGELRKASVRLKCKLLRATVNNPENPFEITIEGSNVVLECRADGHPQDRLEFFRDYEEEERTEQTEVQPDFGGQVNMVLTQCCRHDEPIDKKDESNDMAEGLLLNETSGGASIYERIGLFTVKAGENFSKLLTEHERAETRIITLV